MISSFLYIYIFYVSTCKQTGISSLVKNIKKSYKLFLSLSFAEFLATDVFKEVWWSYLGNLAYVFWERSMRVFLSLFYYSYKFYTLSTMHFYANNVALVWCNELSLEIGFIRRYLVLLYLVICTQTQQKLN